MLRRAGNCSGEDMTLKSNKEIILKNEMGVLIALVALIIFFSLTSDVFMASKNWLNKCYTSCKMWRSYPGATFLHMTFGG